MAEAYCVKDKMKVEVQNPQKITMKNGKPAISGHLPEVREQGLQDRRLIPPRAHAPTPRPARARGGARPPRGPESRARDRHGDVPSACATS